MDAIMEALAFALLIGGQFLAVIAVARSNATQAARGAEGRGLRSKSLEPRSRSGRPLRAFPLSR